MTRIVIVEDESVIALDLAMMLKRMGHKVLGSFDSGEEALPFILKETPDLVLLDVGLAGAMSGIALAERMKIRSSIPFIFITAFSDNKTIDSLRKLKPDAYLVKPFQENNLIANIELALFKQRPKNSSDSFEKVFVKKDQQLIGLNPKDIFWVEAYDNYAYVQLENDRYLLTHTLKAVEDKLVNQQFFRIHKSYLINLSLITTIQEGYAFIDHLRVPIGKSYRKDLLNALTVL
ncbi:MAG: response regulator [Cyclobacteriaceae bacterium]|nr:response regulator [Cyclobacteriaceae bacterium]